MLKCHLITIRPVGAELFQTDGRTDRQTYMTKLIIDFRNFVNAPKNGYSSIFPNMQLNAPLNYSTSQCMVAQKVVLLRTLIFS